MASIFWKWLHGTEPLKQKLLRSKQQLNGSIFFFAPDTVSSFVQYWLSTEKICNIFTHVVSGYVQYTHLDVMWTCVLS